MSTKTHNRFWVLLFVISFMPACCFIVPKQHTATERDVNRLIVKNQTMAEEGGYRFITTESLQGLMASGRNPLIIDTLPSERYHQHHIPGAINIWFPRSPAPTTTWDTELMNGMTLTQFEEKLGPNKKKPLVFYCGRTICDRSHSAAAWAVKLGYDEVYRYAGGINAWRDLPWDGKEAGTTCKAPDTKTPRTYGAL